MPPAGTPPPQLIAFLNANSARQEWSWFLACGPALLIGPWFVGLLSAELWAANPARRHLVAAGFSASLITGSLLAAAGIAWGLFVYLGTQITAPSLILVLAETRHFAEGAICFPAAGAVIAYTLATRGQLPAWGSLAVLGSLAAGLQLANGVDDFVVDGVTGPVGPLALAALLSWVAAMSTLLVVDLKPLRLGVARRRLEAPAPVR